MKTYRDKDGLEYIPPSDAQIGKNLNILLYLLLKGYFTSTLSKAKLPYTKHIVILGSTGSIGRNCLEVVNRYSDRFKVVGLAARDNFELLAAQAKKFSVPQIVIANPEHYDKLRKLVPQGTSIGVNNDAIPTLFESAGRIDLVVNAMVGSAGLKPSLDALNRGINLALANKESLVAGGKLVLKAAAESGAELLPIDSEHSAIFQCLLGEDRDKIAQLILTASGGPFVDCPREEFHLITPDMALKHPNWEMGARITIDSATMVNKGLEVIEARWLFGIPPERIKVVIHRQSIVHSMVRFNDGSYLAQMGAPDMRLPIQFALTYPERLPSPYCMLDFDNAFSLDFEPVNWEKFPGLKLAFQALNKGDLFPTALNAADETAVDAFLKNKIGFSQIPAMIERAMEFLDRQPEYSTTENLSLEKILQADKAVRNFVRDLVEQSA